jgi:hypothetical protein
VEQLETTTRTNKNQPLTASTVIVTVLVILLSLILPPLGIIACIFFLYKALTSRNKMYYLPAILVIVLPLALVYQGHPLVESFKKNDTKVTVKNQPKDPRAYTYSRLDKVSLPGQATGTGMRFEKPEEVKLVADGIDDKSSWGVFRHENNLKEVITIITAASAIDKQLENKEYLNRWNASYSEGEGPSYENAILAAKQFAQNVVGVNYDLELQKAEKYTSSNLKENAWQIDYFAKPKNGTTVLPLKGKIVIAGTQKGFYYFIASTKDYNWHSNEEIWRKVFESIQADQ